MHRLHRQRHHRPRKLPAVAAPADAVVCEEQDWQDRAGGGEEPADVEHACVDGECDGGIGGFGRVEGVCAVGAFESVGEPGGAEGGEFSACLWRGMVFGRRCADGSRTTAAGSSTSRRRSAFSISKRSRTPSASGLRRFSARTRRPRRLRKTFWHRDRTRRTTTRHRRRMARQRPRK